MNAFSRKMRKREMYANTKISSELSLEEFKRLTHSHLNTTNRRHESRLTEIWRCYVDGIVCIDIPIVGIDNQRMLRRQISPAPVPEGKIPVFVDAGKISVLVWIGNVSKGFRPTNSIVWLERLD